MNAGQMRHRIKILRKKKEEGVYISAEPELEEIAEIWAKKEDKLSPKIWGQLSDNALNKKQFIVRYRTDINESLRLGFEGDIYNILGVADLLGNEQWLAILVERVVNVGI